MEYVRCPPPFTVDTNLNEQTSFYNTGNLLAWLLDIDSACADTVTKCVLEIHLALECHIATLMSESVSLWMGIDGSGTTKQRNLTELEFGGFHLTKGTWSHLVNLQEMPQGGIGAAVDCQYYRSLSEHPGNS